MSFLSPDFTLPFLSSDIEKEPIARSYFIIIRFCNDLVTSLLMFNGNLLGFLPLFSFFYCSIIISYLIQIDSYLFVRFKIYSFLFICFWSAIRLV
jgi:hypothetical protein